MKETVTVSGCFYFWTQCRSQICRVDMRHLLPPCRLHRPMKWLDGVHTDTRGTLVLTVCLSRCGRLNNYNSTAVCRTRNLYAQRLFSHTKEFGVVNVEKISWFPCVTVTWRHWSHDHSIHHGPFPICFFIRFFGKTQRLATIHTLQTTDRRTDATL